MKLDENKICSAWGARGREFKSRHPDEAKSLKIKKLRAVFEELETAYFLNVHTISQLFDPFVDNFQPI